MQENYVEMTGSNSGFVGHAFQTRVELDWPIPRVLISRVAYSKMWHYVDVAGKEIGWLGTVVNHGNDLFIEDVYLFRQEVTSVDAVISEDGLAEFAQEMLLQPNGLDLCNKIRFWGHSHVHMATTPSGQDNSQMSLFRDSGHNFFVRGILNKKGRMEFTIYLYSKGLIVKDAEWLVYEPADDSLRESIEQEIKDKVKEKNLISTFWQGVHPHIAFSQDVHPIDLDEDEDDEGEEEL